MNYHKTRVHELGEICQIYPCEQCPFQGRDKTEIMEHKKEHTLYRPRIKQQLTDIYFNEDTEEDEDWTPSKEE